MKATILDCETELFKPGYMIPRLVCVAIDKKLYHHSDPALIPVLTHLFATGTVVGHNVNYDLTVLCRYVGTHEFMVSVYEAFEQQRIHDTLVREQLIDLSQGGLQLPQKNKSYYSLKALAKKYLGVQLDKENSWRMQYAELYDVPIEQWPAEAKEYPLNDVNVTGEIFRLQKQHDDVLKNASRQAYHNFALQLMTAHGVRTDAERVNTLEQSLQKKMAELRAKMIEIGFMRENGSKNKKKICSVVAAAYEHAGMDVPVTAKNNISSSAQVLENAPEHPELKIVVQFTHLEKLASTYLPVLKEGTQHPINAPFHLLATGRRGSRGKNMQTLPREPGIRECYKPREGRVFVAVDFDTAELRAWAQVMVDLFGIQDVPMALMYQKDPKADPHLVFAAEKFLHITIEEAKRRKKEGDPKIKEYRQRAKAPNFGFPGGLGAEKFMTYALGYGVRLTFAESLEIKADWQDMWNAKQYFSYITQQLDDYGYVIQHRSDRVRGGVEFCAACNTLFQGLTADGTYLALCRASRECYTDKNSPLYGSRIWNVSHDEIFAEVPYAMASDAASRLSEIMNKSMEEFTPDVPAISTPSIMDYWSKEVPDTYVDGKLQVAHVPYPKLSWESK